jgi:hypothetical protein
LGVVATAASVTLAHVTEPDQRTLVIAMSAGAAFAAFCLPLIRQRALFALALIGIVLGEGYGLAQTIERILSVRDERTRMVAAENQPRVVLESRVTRLTEELRTADAAVLEEAGKGGCKSSCTDKKALATEARTRLETAERDLARMPPPKGAVSLAGKLGVPADLVDVALAAAVSLTLLCFQLVFLSLAHATGGDRVEPVPDTSDAVEPLTRHE